MRRASLLGHAKNKREKEAAYWSAEEYGTFKVDHAGDDGSLDDIYICMMNFFEVDQDEECAALIAGAQGQPIYLC